VSRRFILLAVALGALLLAPSAALAGNVTYSGSTLEFTAGPGEQNDLIVSYDIGPGEWVIRDFTTNPTETSDNCTASSDTVRCSPTGPATLRFLLGDRNDTLNTGTPEPFEPFEVFGGDGDDVLDVFTNTGDDHRLEGGAGNDILRTGDGDDTLRGDGGDDSLEGYEGTDSLDGGAGDDELFPSPGNDDYRGGEGTDTLGLNCFASSGCNPSLSVTLDDQPNDGTPGQTANVHSDVEDIEGDQEDSTFVGSAAANFITGRGGADTIDGGGGEDVLSGGSGNDDLRARDGARDTVRCGSGADTVTADTFDSVSADCENVSRPAPETTITSGPEGSTSDTTPDFGFSSSEQGSTFQCRVDGEEFRTCGSPTTIGPLAFGQHTFEVRAVDSLGNPDQTPASRTSRWRWRRAGARTRSSAHSARTRSTARRRAIGSRRSAGSTS
jgi:RTX calcium-binding nonapeptide repeat (4 copies)